MSNKKRPSGSRFKSKSGSKTGLRELLTRKMSGRYGTDALGKALLVLWFVLALLVIAFHSVPVVSYIFYGLGIACGAAVLCRMLSKNVDKRSEENREFLRKWNPVKGRLELYLRMFRERKTHKYVRCPRCRAFLRFPREKGAHSASCPRCGEHFDFRIR